MHHRYSSVVATIATSLLMACGDARLDDVTAPRTAATPATPVSNTWPSREEFAAAGIPTTIGMSVTTQSGFVNDYSQLVVDARVRFEWANFVSATIRAWLLNQAGARINEGQASMTWQRLFLPVASGDTTFTVRVSTNNITCGLVGKHSYTGTAAQRAVDSRLVTISLYEQNVGETHGADIVQPACPPDECPVNPLERVVSAPTNALAATAATCEDDTPTAPSGGEEPTEVCYDVWRELWVYDYNTRRLTLKGEWYVGRFCYQTNET